MNRFYIGVLYILKYSILNEVFKQVKKLLLTKDVAWGHDLIFQSCLLVSTPYGWYGQAKSGRICTFSHQNVHLVYLLITHHQQTVKTGGVLARHNGAVLLILLWRMRSYLFQRAGGFRAATRCRAWACPPGWHISNLVSLSLMSAFMVGCHSMGLGSLVHFMLGK